ncbi:hypothetical protein FA95DRAFT_1569480 [Auriscalpium vulgare]|uniref:Uncharacterized protein n=1 Tax=Auriscalpium vulgare TaxID=40419 RepID=A0ACB8S6X7_9AGAM|nr:hypothetical protein FA95DRAFT_1569480 [Auriscalpium vulgare]
MFALSFLTIALAAVPAFAAPARITGCPVPSSVLQVPTNQTQLVPPTTAPSYVGLGVGVQNYTCSAAGAYVTAGAYAELFDISCLYNTPSFANIQNDAYNIWNQLPASFNVASLIGVFRSLKNFDALGQHYFITNAAGGLSPKFDFTSTGKTSGNPNAYVVAAKVGDLPSPTGPQDVDWLELNGTAGKLASQVFRVNTKAGQPPSSCTPGSPLISVKYTAKYLFYGSTL